LDLACALVVVLCEVLADLRADASPKRLELIDTLFTLNSESKGKLVGVRREELAGTTDTTTFRRKTEWPLLQQIAQLLLERSAISDDLRIGSEPEAELVTTIAARRYFLGPVLLYKEALYTLLYPPPEGGEFLQVCPPPGISPAIFALLYHGYVLATWSVAVNTGARGLMEEDDVFGILQDSLLRLTPFEPVDQSLLRYTLTSHDYELAPSQFFLEDTNRGKVLVSKWKEWRESCQCEGLSDHAGCMVHTHLTLCDKFVAQCLGGPLQR
jgi:hypothetical protein